MTEAEQIAAFLLRKGATKIAEGETALGYTRRDWHAAMRGEPTPKAQRDIKRTQREDTRIRIVTDHLGREFYRNSDGEWL